MLVKIEEDEPTAADYLRGAWLCLVLYFVATWQRIYWTGDLWFVIFWTVVSFVISFFWGMAMSKALRCWFEQRSARRQR